eukprot:TCONS_00000092-protein
MSTKGMENQLLKIGKNETVASYQEAFFVAVDRLSSSDCTKADHKKFVALCKKIKDVHFLCKITERLLRLTPYVALYYENEGFIEMLASLLETLLKLLTSKSYSKAKPVKIDSMSGVVITLFANVNDGLFNPDILTKLISNQYISQEPSTIEAILWGLLRKDYLVKKDLTSNKNFCTLFRQFGIATAKTKTAQFYRYYIAIIQFLVKNYDWELAKELLPSVLDISDNNEDFEYFFALFEGLESVKSEHLKILVQSGISFFAKAVSREKLYGIGYIDIFEYQSMLKYLKIVFKDDFYCNTAKQLTTLDEFKSKDYEKMCNTTKESILQRLIQDLKKDFYFKESYIDLVRVQIENLKTLQDKGCPKSYWEQPDAIFYDEHIEEFLESDKVTLVVSDEFENDLEYANSWINDYAGPHLHRGYSFSAIARLSTEGTVEVILQKEKHIYERKRDGYFRLMNELFELETFLQSPKIVRIGTKRKYNLRERKRK